MLSQLTRVVNRYLFTGVNTKTDPEQVSKAIIINLFGFIGGTITLALGIRALLESNMTLGIALLVTSFTYLLAHLCQRLPASHSARIIPTTLLQLNIMVLMTYLLITGGVANTGPVWISLIPPVYMFLGGLKVGTIYTMIFVVIYSLIMFMPGEPLLTTSYSFEYKTRTLMAFITLSGLAAVYEFSRKQSYAKIRDLSKHYAQQARLDILTQLPNRRSMLESLDYEFNRSKRNGQEFSLMILDVDYFKQFNDTHGHDGGDQALIQLAKFFSENRRSQDVVCRWGGEEFLFLLPHTSNKDAMIFAEKIRKGVENLVVSYNGNEFALTVSIGVSQVTPDSTIKRSLLLADERLYDAKAQGRNRVEGGVPELVQSAKAS